MICNHCGKNNQNIAKFCEQCGKPMTYTPPVNSEPSTVYFHQTVTPPAPTTPPMPQSPFSPYEALKKAVGKGWVICCLVLSIIFGATPSIVLSAIALSFRVQYENALSYNDIRKANTFVSKIKTLTIIAWIILAVTILSVIMFYVLFFIFGFEDAFSNGTLIKLMF